MNLVDGGEPIRLCALSDLDATGAKSVVLGTGLEQKRYIVTRSGDCVRCYINRCPHKGTPLETFADRFLDETGGLLICSTHGARFRVSDGACIAGPCVGAQLQSCKISVIAEQVCLDTQWQ